MYSSVKFPMNAVKSFPEAQFAWTVRRHRSNYLDEKITDGENGRLLITQSGDLYIVGVTGEDTGTYTCVVSNPFVAKDIIIEFVLTVLEGASSLIIINRFLKTHFTSQRGLNAFYSLVHKNPNLKTLS